MTDSTKGLSIDEMKLLSDFSNTVSARELNKGVKIQSLTLSYTDTDGFTINLVETKNPTSPAVTTPSSDASTSE